MTVLEEPKALIRLGPEGERIAFGGYEMIFKSPLPGSDAGGMVVDYTLPPRSAGAPLHYHEELIESFYVLSGELWMSVGGQEFVAGPGSYVLVMPGTAHAFANRSSSRTRILAQASNPDHKQFLTKLFEMARAEAMWPPRDIDRLFKLGRRYDTYYLESTSRHLMRV